MRIFKPTPSEIIIEEVGKYLEKGLCMNKTIKIIDLLNKIANGEEVPDAIKWGCHDFEWLVYEYKAKGELGEPTLLDYLSQCPQMLNDEIITFYKTEEPQEHKIPEKLKLSSHYGGTFVEEQKFRNKRDDEIARKINKILDYLENLK